MTYHKVSERGRGGFGVVDEVRDDHGSPFARKTLVVPLHLTSADLTPRFEREVKYQGAINHLNVVPIVDSDLSVDPPWFVMPLAEGSLQDLMALDKRLGVHLNTALFDILAGLEEIHRRGYCHRDLKPGNILRFLDAGGVSYFALSDFGLMAVGEDASSTLTPTGAAGGTPAYQAPECAINFKRATTRSDIYSFGALLHDIFSPIARKLPHEELKAPGDIGAVIERCTKRNAHRRYNDVQQLREALFTALSTFVYTFESGEEEQIVRLLSDEDATLSADEWDRVFDFLDANSEDGQPSRNIFRALRREHIAQLAMDDQT